MNHKTQKNKILVLLLTFSTMLISVLTFGIVAFNKPITNSVSAHTTATDHIHYNSASQSGTAVELTFPFYLVHGHDKKIGFAVTYTGTMANVVTGIDFYQGISDTITSVDYTQITTITQLNTIYSAITSKLNYSAWDEYGAEMRYGYNNVFLLTKTNPLDKSISKANLESIGFKTNPAIAPTGYTNQKAFNFTFDDGAVPDTVSPVINGSESVYVTNVNNPVTVASLKALLYAFDEVDGNLTARITVDSDGYTGHQTVLGLYPIVFSCTDNSLNKGTITINVRVVDVTIPVINGAVSFTSNMSAPLTVADIKATFTVTDNYNTLTNTSIIVTNDGFTTNKLIKGTYNVSFEVSDSSGNKGVKTVAVTTVDNIKPVITGQASYTKGQSAVLSMDTIKAGLSATDNCDGSLTSSIVVFEDNYTGNGATLGTHTIKYRVTDVSGNISDLFVVSVVVSDSYPPVFFFDQNFFVDSTTTLTQTQIIDLLGQTGQINLSMSYNASFVIDEYQGTQTPGQYDLSVKVDYADGETEIVNLSLTVVAQEFVYTPALAWYSTWSGWVSQWFGLRIVANWLLKLLGISLVL